MEVMSAFPNLPSAFTRYRVAVIGGGISGLAATHRLTELLPRAEIELFDAAGRLGGVIHTVERDGYLIEQSADNFLVKPSHGVELCQKLSASVELVTTDESRRRAFVVRDGRLVPIPAGFFLMSPRALGPVLASPALSLSGKLRLLAEPFVPPRFISGQSPHVALPDESVASFARRRLGRETFAQIVQPLVAGIYTADPERLSMAATLPQFLEYERTAGSLLRATVRLRPLANEGTSGARYGMFVAPRRGMSNLIQSLTNQLKPVTIHLNTPVASARHESGRWCLTLGLQDRAGGCKGKSSSSQVELPGARSTHESRFDAIIIALPAYAASRLLLDCDRLLAAELAAIDYAGCAVVSMGFERSQIGHDLNGFGFVVPKSEDRRIIAGSFASLKFPGRAPADHALIRAFLGGALQPELLALSDDELIGIAREELSMFLRISGIPIVVDIARWPRSMPQYHVGHLNRVDRIERLTARYPSLALAGNAYRGVGIPQCIASGQRAAERIVSNIGLPLHR